MINKRHYLICILSLLNFLSFGQGLTCDQAAPFCAGNAALVFPNTSDNSNAEGGPDYGCLLQQPNPAWYYLQIGQAGDLDISIAQNTQQDFSGIQQDVDFICYGPFTSINNCGNLTASNTIGCGYSTAAVENFTIVNAVAGEIYILLITNFDGGAGFISLEQTNSTSSDAGATDCSIVSTINYCDGEIASLDATNASAVSYVWYQGAVMLAETGPILNNVIAPSASYRVEKLDSGGALIEEEVFNVVFNAVPVANPVTDYFLCDDTVIDGFTEFNLSTKDTEIVGTQTGVTLSYHLEQSEADANTDALPNLFSNTENPQTIYVRIENSLNTNCYDTTSFNLNVYQSPTANQPLDMFVCDDVNNDGVENFILSTQTATILLGQTGVTVSYHETPFDANEDLSPLTSPYANSSSPQTIYVRVEDDVTGCYQITTFQLIVNSLPAVIVPTPFNACDDNADNFENFMLTDKNTEILNGQTGISVTFHANLPDAQLGDNELTMPYTNVLTSETLYVRLENDATGCYNTTTLDINVYQLPRPQTPMPIELCDDVNTSDGIETFDLTIREADVINGEVGVSATYYETLLDAEEGMSPIPDPTMYLSASSLQTIYVRVTNDTSDCFAIVELELIVLPLPLVIAVPDLIACEVGTDGYYAFNLDSKTDEILNGQSSTDFVVSYHATPVDAQTGTGDLVSPYTNTTVNSQQIYVNITNTLTGCDISTVSFNIEVQEGAVATMPLNEYVICDNVGDNDGIGQFDLSTQDAEILGTQSAAAYSVSYYQTAAEAEAGVSMLPTTYENISNPQVIYARVENDATTCYATTTLTLRVELLPIFNIEDSYILCENSANGVITTVSPPVIDTGLNNTNYSFAWTEVDDPTTVLGTDSSYVPTLVGTYTVMVTDAATGCENIDATQVIASSPPDVEATVSTLAFADTHIIEVTATGQGEYEYSLDDGPWVNNDSNTSSYTFTDVMAGEHTITVRDINGCGESSDMVMIMDYPLFFTPNGDNFNPTWNIKGISSQIDAKIYIFDRYGKLLKQISPTGIGWDGTYNGDPLPSNDYWFIVEYREPSSDVRKEFKAHFTLKR